MEVHNRSFMLLLATAFTACAGASSGDVGPQAEIGSLSLAASNGNGNGNANGNANGNGNGADAGVLDAGGEEAGNANGDSTAMVDAATQDSGATESGSTVADAGTGGQEQGNANGQGNGSSSGSADAGGGLDLDVRRVLAVTEQPILARFSFERVLDQLVAQSGVPGLTSLQLFQQWWDTHNPAPGLGLGPNCNSEVDPVYGPSINGFPYDCRPAPAEGVQTTCTSLTDPACNYIPIGLFNRFDLAPVDGSHCGEYRIVYAKETGVTNSRDRNLIIFEAMMPNPLPHQGIKGCRKIVETWADLNDVADLEARADALESFYFNGHGNLPPVIDITHYGDNALGAGQIRTNEFIQPTGQPTSIWTLREFKLRKRCDESTCRMTVFPVTVKGTPFGPLFDAANTDSRAALFQAGFVNDNVSSLAATTLSNIAMSIPDGFNAPQGHESGSTENNYVFHFGTTENLFRTSIQDKLTAIGSTLTPDNIVARAQAQSCAGCHRLSNNADLGGGLTWPASTGFTHITERTPEVVDGVTRFRISAALEDSFLPVRKEVMEEYLLNQPTKYRGKGRTLGGSETD